MMLVCLLGCSGMCLLSEVESGGEVELFCSLNCRETADNAAAAGYQLPAAAAPVS